jgi:hypothetical protein
MKDDVDSLLEHSRMSWQARALEAERTAADMANERDAYHDLLKEAERERDAYKGGLYDDVVNELLERYIAKRRRAEAERDEARSYADSLGELKLEAEAERDAAYVRIKQLEVGGDRKCCSDLVVLRAKLAAVEALDELFPGPRSSPDDFKEWRKEFRRRIGSVVSK